MEIMHQRISGVHDLLMKAWRERWSDVHFSTQLKRILPPGVSGDTCRLADMILMQAFVGPNPNALMLSYLKHAISSQVVSHAAMFSALLRYQDISVTRPYCTRSLLDLLNMCMSKISCHGPPEECILLCQALLQALHWLVKSSTLTLEKMRETRDRQVLARNLDLIAGVLGVLCQTRTNQILLHIAKLEDSDVWKQIEHIVNAAKLALNPSSSQQTPGSPRQVSAVDQILNVAWKEKSDTTLRQRLEKSYNEVLRIPMLDVINLPQSANTLELRSMSCCVNIMTFMEASLNLTSDMQPFVEQLILIERLQELFLIWTSENIKRGTVPLSENSSAIKNVPRSSVYIELCRACFMGLIDKADSSEELKWHAFTYLKLPQIMSKLKDYRLNSGDVGDGTSYFVNCFEQLMNFNVLLDLVDSKYKNPRAEYQDDGPEMNRSGVCEVENENHVAPRSSSTDCMQQLLPQFVKLGLLTENQVRDLLAKRSATKRIPPHVPVESQQTIPKSTLIIKAEPTVTRMLTTLESDYNKNPDELLGVLGHMMSGQSFELISAAGATSGKLKKFAAKYIKISDQARQSGPTEQSKASQTRAVLFDISFLMLCHIAQLYGAEMVITNGGDSFFETWALQSLPDDNGPKPMGYIPGADQAKVDMLLTQCQTGFEFKTLHVRWNEVCTTVPHVIQELLNAWEHGNISVENIQKIVDSLKGKLCCVPICCVAWLCSHITTLSSAEYSKPQTMLEMFSASSNSSQAAMQMYDNERNTMMTTIIKKMIATIPSMSRPSKDSPTAHAEPTPLVPLVTPSTEVLSSIFHGILKKGTVDRKAVFYVDQLLNCGGVYWFCRGVIFELVNLHRKDELIIGVEAAFALFQFDIEQLTLTLIRRILPRLLSDPNHRGRLADPMGHALAKLTILCLAATLTYQSSVKDVKSKESPFRLMRGRKRARGDLDRDDVGGLKDDGRPSKLRRLLSVTEEDGGGPSSIAVGTGGNFLIPQMPQALNEPINKALVSLFQLFSSLTSGSLIDPRTQFVQSFMHELLYCGSTITSSVLQFAPVNMITQILNTSSGQFLQNFALIVGRIDSNTAHKLAVRALCQAASKR